MNLKARIERLEAARSRGVIEIVRLHPGVATLVTFRNGRVTHRREATAEEADRLTRGAITIERTYGGALG
jgi:hypothetical protein